jgi:hypothetical protein
MQRNPVFARSASRLQQVSQILQVPVPFFFDRAPGQSGATAEIADSDSYVNDFLATSDGLALVEAFTRIREAITPRYCPACRANHARRRLI